MTYGLGSMRRRVAWVGHRASDAAICGDHELEVEQCASIMGRSAASNYSASYEERLGFRDSWSSNDQGLAEQMLGPSSGGAELTVIPFRASELLDNVPGVAAISSSMFMSLSTRLRLKEFGEEGIVQTPQILEIASEGRPTYDDLAVLLGVPFVAKGDGSVSGSECFVVESAADFDVAVRRCGARLNTAWEFVPGPSLNFHFACFESGIAVPPPTIQLIEGASSITPFHFAGSDFDTGCDDATLAAARSQVRSLASHLRDRGYRGFGGVDVVVDGAGRACVVDLNPRLQGSTLPLSRGIRSTLGVGVGSLQVASFEGEDNDLVGSMADLPAHAPEWGGQIFIRHEAQSEVLAPETLRDGAVRWLGEEWVDVPHDMWSLSDTALLVCDCARPSLVIRPGALICRILYGANGYALAQRFASERVLRQVVASAQATDS